MPGALRSRSAPQALASASASSRRSDLISSRSLAAYSKRRSSAAASISSSSSTIVRRSSSAVMPSVSRRRPRRVGTFDSIIRKSEMSEMPFWLVVGDLDGAATVGLADRVPHRRGLLVGVHDHLAADVPGGAADRLDQRGLAAQESLLVRVEDGHKRNL